MTKYILHGGAWQSTADYKKFFSEMIKDLPSQANILCVYFAREKFMWDENFEEDKIKFLSVSRQKNFNFEMAVDKVNVFLEQIKTSDLIYIRGGDTHILQKFLEKIDHLEVFWQGKTVAGSSAGALVLSKYYYENDDDTFNKGLGILPIKVFCHYTKEKSDKLEELKKIREDVKQIYAISEEEFFIINN
jgi:peptidase E